VNNKFKAFIILISVMSMNLFAGIIYQGANYTETMMPYSFSGSTETFIVVSGTIDSYNSSRMSSFEINGVDMMSSSTLPSPEDGKKYFIHFKGRNKNSSISINGSNDWSQPSMTVTPTSLTGFTAEPNTPSPEQSFMVSGQDLSANISLNAPTNFEISTTSGSAFGSSLTLTPSGGTVASTTIYVRLRSGLSEGSYNGEEITISTLSLSDQIVTLSGIVQIPSPSMAVSATSLSGFIAQPDLPSLEQSFTVSGQDLTSNISLSAPTDYEISTTSGSGFSSSLTLTPSGGTVSSTSIYVRLRSGLSAGSYNGEAITISTTGISDQTVTLSGDVIESPNPSMIVSTTSLSGFSYMSGNGPSSEYTFTVSGLALTSNIILSAPTDYEISTTSGSGFSSSLTLTPSAGTVSSTTIYVRLKSGLSVGTYDGEDIIISTTGTNDLTVTFSGDVIEIPSPSITVSTTTLTGFTAETDTPSPEQSFTISGQDLTANISLAAPTNYEISTTSGSAFGSSLTLTQSSGTVASTTIYVRLRSGLSAGFYNGEDITISTSGVSDLTVTCSGEVQASTNPTVINWNGNNYTFVEMPYSYDGGAVTRIYTYGKITSFSTNNKISSLEINGQTYAINQTFTDPPPSIDQKYFITFSPKNSRGHFEINGETRDIVYNLNIKVFLQGTLNN
jgi:hypothetical protein